MFGGQVAAPINSPHLRRSGSRAVVSDLGSELGNGVENSYVHPLEINGSKNASIPLVTAAIVPSPTLLWRFKTGWQSVMRMSADLRDLFLYEAFLYYNPLLLVDLLEIILLVLILQTTMVWLWGINLWVFSRSNINYAKIFDLDQNHLTHREIWKAITFSDFFLADILTSMAK
ncbi:hypothetical protein Golob_020684, partial [Gossypium lobatum]|nr:hypothetical protein [Gossypium lobatum]